MLISRYQVLAADPKTPAEHQSLFKSFEKEKKSKRFTLTAEGIADEMVSGIVADEWLQNPHLCLFRIETPSTVSQSHLSRMESKLEKRANKMSFQKSQGIMLKYGQDVQLRHVHSNRFLSLNLLTAAVAPGAWSVSVHVPSEFLCRQISLLPFNRSQNIGDPIKYGDAMSIVFQTENLKYYLQAELIKPDLLDINSTHKPASWKLIRYVRFDESHDAIRFGEMVTIKYTKMSMFMALRKEKQPSNKAPPKKGLTGLGLLKAAVRKIGPDSVSDVERCQEPIVTKAEVQDYSQFWVLQNVNVLQGGCVTWKSKFYIKSALTGQYLGANLRMQSRPDPECYFFFPRPDTFKPDSLVPNGYPLMIKSKGDMVLSPDQKKSYKETLNHLVPIVLTEKSFESGGIGLVMETLGQDQRESLFELEYAETETSNFFNLINGLYPKFQDTQKQIEEFKAKCEASRRNIWEAAEELEKRLTTLLSALKDVSLSFRMSQGDELETKQKIFAGLGFHSVLIEIASILHTLFDSYSIKELASELLIDMSRQTLEAIWNLLNDVVLENEASAKILAEHQGYLCELLKYDTKRIGALLTEIFRMVDPEIKDPKQFYHEWCGRLETLTKRNLQEQTIYMRIIRNLCEIGDIGLLEYQREITRHLFTSEIAIDLIIFSTLHGNTAISFGSKGPPVGIEEFKQLNPDLVPFIKVNGEGRPIVLLKDLSDLEDYRDYVQTALMLIHCICRGKCTLARELADSRLSINVHTALLVSQDNNVHINIRQACLFLLEALCISGPPFEAYSENDTSFNYADIKLQEGKDSHQATQLMKSTSDYPDVTQCLKMVFEFWMSKTTPSALRNAEVYQVMNYLLGMLRLTVAAVEFQHCTELYSNILLKVMQYLLVGFIVQGKDFVDRYWGTELIVHAAKQAANDRKVKLLGNELLNWVLTTLLATKKMNRRIMLSQVISQLILEAKYLKNPLFTTGLVDSDATTGVTRGLKEIVNPERTDLMIKDFLTRTEKAKTATNSTALLSTPAPEFFVPSFDFRDILNKPPEMKDSLIRVILEWGNFSSQLKNKMIDVMNEVFKENRLFDEFLKSSDVISLGPISQIYNRLRWIKENSELSSLIVRAKFECFVTGKSKSLTRIIHTVEYLTNFLHPRTNSSPFILEKAQSISRQLGLHTDIMQLWKLVRYLDKIGKGVDTPTLKLKGALVSFLLYFIYENPCNIKSLAKLLEPHHYVMNIRQYPILLRMINDYSHLAIRDVTRLLIYILEEAHSSDKGLRAMAYFEKLMSDKNGQLKRTIQNVASTLLSEKVAEALVLIKERSEYMALLLENLALSAEDNPPVITQCRHLISLSRLQELMINEESPMVLSSMTYFLYTVYIKKNTEVKTLGLSDVSEILEYVFNFAMVRMRDPKEMLKLVNEGSYAMVYFTKSPAFTDIHINLKQDSPELTRWRFLCKESDGRCTGVLQYMVDILDNLDASPVIQQVLNRFYYALLECTSKIERMEEQTQGILSFSPLLSVFRQASSRIKDWLSPIQTDFLEEALAMARGDSYEVDADVIEQLKATIKGSLSCNIDSEAMNSLAVDESMAVIMKTGYQYFSKVFTLENEDEYISNIVSLIDDRLSNGMRLSKKQIKELIGSLTRKIRRLQRLFTSSKQRTLFFKIVEGIVPDEEFAEFKIQLNPLFKETRIVESAVLAIMRNESFEEVIAALSFLRKIFLLQSREFMGKFQEWLNQSSLAYPLFMKIQEEMSKAKASILENAQIQKSRKNSVSSLVRRIAVVLVGQKTTESNTPTKQQEVLINMLYFIQICCDNCNEPFQIFFRQQGNTEGKADVDLVSGLANFLIDIRVAKEYIFSNGPAFDILEAALSVLIDLVTGPCSTNQMILGNNVRIYLLINSLISECQGKEEGRMIEIHTSCINFLFTLNEGHPDPSVLETMSKFLDLGMLRQGCEEVHKSHIVGHEEELSLELSSLSEDFKGVVEVAILQAILLVKLKFIGIIHDELSKFEMLPNENVYTPAYAYYSQYIGYVEIDRNGKLEVHFFPIPWKCKYITPSTRLALIVEVDRSSHQEKIEDFLNQVVICRLEMQHQQYLNNSKTFKRFSSHWQTFGKMSYYIALVINIVLLISIQEPDFSDLKGNVFAFTSVAILGIMQIFAYMACFFFNIIEYYPKTLTSGIQVPKEFEMDEFPKLDNSDSQTMHGVHASFQSVAKKDYPTELQAKLKEVLFNFDLYYTYSYFLISILAVYEPVFYPFLLLDMVKQTPELVNVLKSVTLNFRQLILTMWLGVIIIYLFAIGSFVYYHDYYSTDSNLYCFDLWNCFFSTLNMGVRSGGDFQDSPDKADYWSRMLFDMMFFMIIIIILMNIIFGIIIDTFAELRDGRNQVLEDIHSRCYICGQERSLIELKGSGWSYHFMCEHSAFAYLSFLIYIDEKKVYDCSGLEKHVKECFKNKDTSFLPKTSIEMEKRGDVAEPENAD